ncbi:uncharacterized protein LOC111337770 [Stylophora pistillata]|uniref:uncharacterized protein LOC111337770 n=1 Tax=Stylophora pistillata TaxID=50429 RepID=UPI000C046C47|nr:uncharacterized protein LOC111337770 [Stylophora pistillata]
MAVWEIESLPEGLSSIPENHSASSMREGLISCIFFMAAVRQIISSPQEIPSSVTAAVSIPSCNGEDSSEGRIIIEDEGSSEGQDVGLCPVVVLADDNTDIETEFDELPTKSILVHRAQLRQDFIMENPTEENLKEIILELPHQESVKTKVWDPLLVTHYYHLQVIN